MKQHYKDTREEDNIGELGDDFFAQATRIGRPVSEHPKERISIRLSPEVTHWFRQTGKGWQTRMDKVLMEWVTKQADFGVPVQEGF